MGPQVRRKAGKRVDGFVLYDFDHGPAETAADQFAFRLKRLTYDEAEDQAYDLVDEWSEVSRVKMHDFQEKGVDVAPAGFGPFKKATPEFEVDADWTSYTVRDRSDTYNLPACYNTGKRDVKRFYRWVTDNWGRLSRLTYNEVTNLMSKEGFKFRSYCRMD